jgi:hypothetical protein
VMWSPTFKCLVHVDGERGGGALASGAPHEAVRLADVFRLLGDPTRTRSCRRFWRRGVVRVRSGRGGRGDGDVGCRTPSGCCGRRGSCATGHPVGEPGHGPGAAHLRALPARDPRGAGERDAAVRGCRLRVGGGGAPLRRPARVLPIPMLVVAVLGLAANLVGFGLLRARASRNRSAAPGNSSWCPSDRDVRTRHEGSQPPGRPWACRAAGSRDAADVRRSFNRVFRDLERWQATTHPACGRQPRPGRARQAPRPRPRTFACRGGQPRRRAHQRRAAHRRAAPRPGAVAAAALPDLPGR